MKHRLPRFHGAGYMPRHAAHDGYRMLAVHSGDWCSDLADLGTCAAACAAGDRILTPSFSQFDHTTKTTAVMGPA